MFVLFALYLVLFLAGFFLFGAAFTATAFQGLIFTAGILSVSLAVALLFQQRFLKSKKTATTNWAAPELTDSQLLYAANDAYGAVSVYHALGLNH
jgi:hypothetical protein